MPPSDRDRRVVEHLATKVMGWTPWSGDQFRYVTKDTYGTYRLGTIDLDSWADAGMVWERAREMGIQLDLIGADKWFGRIWNGPNSVQYLGDSGPRAICEAIYRATGGTEECTQVSDKEEGR